MSSKATNYPYQRQSGVGREERGLAPKLLAALIGLGLSLLVLGLLLAAPYVGSRLWTPPASADAVAGRHGEGAEVYLDAPQDASSAGGDPESSLHGEADQDLVSPAPHASREPAAPTRLHVPKLSLEAPIVPVDRSTAWVDGRQVGVWDVPDGGAVGWHAGSARLGEIGNTVLNGHNTTGGEVFRDLYRLEAGDTLTIYSELEGYGYVVSKSLVLPEAGQPWDLRLQNASFIEPTADERVTLVTCHPYGSLRNRLIVIALPTETAPDAP